MAATRQKPKTKRNPMKLHGDLDPKFVIPSMTEAERHFCLDILAGMNASESYRRHIAGPEEDVTGANFEQRVLNYKNSTRIKILMNYLKSISPTKLIQDTYEQILLFGDQADRLKAAKEWSAHRFAERDSVHRFLQILNEIQAEVVIGTEEGFVRQKLPGGNEQ